MDPLDDLLDRSAPATHAVPEADLRGMVVAARGEAGRPRRPRRIAAGIAATVLVAGGATFAGVAAASDLFWSDWVENPTGEYSFTLPSGATCTAREGDVRSSNAEFAAAIERWFQTTDVMAVIDVDKYLDLWHNGPDYNVFHHPDGTAERLVPGSPHYDADREYKAAVGSAVQDKMLEDLRGQGFFRINYTSKGEVLCSKDVPAVAPTALEAP